MKEKRVGQAPGNWMHGDSKSEVENSQVSRQEKVLQTARKREKKDQTQIKSEENPPGTRKLAACSPEFRKYGITNHRYMSLRRTGARYFGATERWKGQVEDLNRYPSYQDAVRLDGEPIEFEWKNFPGFSSLSLLREIQNDLVKDFMDRIIFISMFDDIEWKKNDDKCIANADEVRNYAMNFLQGHWTFLGPGSGNKWYGDSHDP